MAASEGQVGVLELLLTRQANIEAADPDGLTPVAFAVIRGQTRALDLLIKAGANVSVKVKKSQIFASSTTKFQNMEVRIAFEVVSQFENSLVFQGF